MLFNIIVHAFLSLPTPLQQLAFEQPNVAVAYFPFIWLPTFVVPVVYVAHIIAIQRLWSPKQVEQPQIAQESKP